MRDCLDVKERRIIAGSGTSAQAKLDRLHSNLNDFLLLGE